MKIVIFVIILSLFLSGCDLDWSTFADRIPLPVMSDNNSINITSPIIKRVNYIHFGSWYIDKLTQAKLRESTVKYTIQDVIQDFDLIAIQGIQDPYQKVIPELLVGYDDYDYIISGQLGKDEPKEQFAFIYNTQIIRFIGKSTYKDRDNLFERDPFIGYFQVGNYDFVMVQLHIKETDATQEIINIQKVYDFAENEFDDNDIIILGNLNADCSYYNTHELEDFKWVIDEFEDTTTTSNDCTYDRIIVGYDLYDNILSSGVYKLEKELSINNELAFVVSSHYPVESILSIPNFIININETDIQ